MDRVMSVRTTRPFRGISAWLVLPLNYSVQGEDRHNYFDAYLGLDWFVEAGIFRYGSRQEWTLFLNAGRRPGQAANWWEQQVTPSSRMHFKLAFISRFRAAFYVDGVLTRELPLAWPISPNIYAQGGVQVKACHGAVDQDQTVYYDQMEFRDIQVSPDGTTWQNLGSAYRADIKNAPPPEMLSDNPLITTYTANRSPILPGFPQRIV